MCNRLWGDDHDFTLEEVLTEIAYFRGESYHTVRECGQHDSERFCINSNFSRYARLVRSECNETVGYCRWNDQEFDCCKYFLPMQTELGLCYALNSMHSESYVMTMNYSFRLKDINFAIIYINFWFIKFKLEWEKKRISR